MPFCSKYDRRYDLAERRSFFSIAPHQSENGSLTSQEGPQSVYNPDNLLTNVFHPWTAWSECNRKCHQTRKRHCKKPRHCGKSYIKEKQNCFGDLCQTKKVSKNRMKLLRLRKNGKFVKQILYKYLYGTWTKWTVCSRNCMKERYRKCKQPAMCGDSFIQEERQCRRATLTCRKQYVLRTFVTVNELSKPKGDKLEEEIKKIVNVSGTPHLPGRWKGRTELCKDMRPENTPGPGSTNVRKVLLICVMCFKTSMSVADFYPGEDRGAVLWRDFDRSTVGPYGSALCQEKKNARGRFLFV
ncbi:hypothetical protein MAR_028496 [Mya arenaria]|uniref:Uncharacterized protein n=1 Tax=Mya arenaria TaxID=6604 RepID=A0ABY7DDS4_MYAAR|nr:hypothetical protein MAR_028496 [Mya arenaria]